MADNTKTRFMKTAQLKTFMMEHSLEADDVLKKAHPTAAHDFETAVLRLRGIILLVRKTYPDAQYYVNDDQLCLMLGESHTMMPDLKADANPELVAAMSIDLIGLIGGGGW